MVDIKFNELLTYKTISSRFNFNGCPIIHKQKVHIGLNITLNSYMLTSLKNNLENVKL